MFTRTHAALLALTCCSGFALSAQAQSNYSQSFSATPSGWSTSLGAWNATGGEYRNAANTASPATIAYYNSNSLPTNYTYAVKAYSEWPGTGNQVGLVFGLTDATHYYAVLVNMSGRVSINQISGTSNTELTSQTLSPADLGLAEDTWFDLDIFVNQHKDAATGENSGHEVTVRVNKKFAIVKYLMSSVAGKIGVIARADMGHFDDVNVTYHDAARIFRGTFRGLNGPLQLALDPGSCSYTSDGRRSCWGDITGQDLSGDTWPFHLWGDDARLQFNSKAKDPVVQDYVDASLVSVPGHVNQGNGEDGDTTDALKFELKKMYEQSHPPQILYNLQPVPGVTQHDLYMRFWVKIPTNSALSYWHSLFQMKTATDYRLIFNIQTNTVRENGVTKCEGGAPHWVLQADGVANQDSTPPFWVECNDSPNAAVPIGKWFKVEMFLHRALGATGRFWVAIDGNTIFDKQQGANGFYAPNSTEPINRLLMPQLYGGDTYPKYQLVDDVEVWDDFPDDASAH
jgi:hypothetical protein